MENIKHETLASQLLCEEDEIIAKRLQEEEEKELGLLLQEDSKSLELALKLQAENSSQSKENDTGEIIL